MEEKKDKTAKTIYQNKKLIVKYRKKIVIYFKLRTLSNVIHLKLDKINFFLIEEEIL